MRRGAVVLFLAAAVAASSSSAYALDFHGFRCQLPGWPGHPAPSCDPNASEDQCCQGTHCTVDSLDPSLHVCLPDASSAVMALSAHALASRAESTLHSLVNELKQDSVDAYLASSSGSSQQHHQKHQNEAVRRAQRLSTVAFPEQPTTLAAHEYIPTLAPHTSNTNATTGGNREDEYLHRAADELREADVQLHRAKSPEDKRAILERVRRDLLKLLNSIDLELSGHELHPPPSLPLPTRNASAVPAEDAGGEDDEDAWTKYLPHIPIATQDRRPGSLGGPCGLTSYRDFGPCVNKHAQRVVCVGLTVKHPGVCRLNDTTTTTAEAELHRAHDTLQQVSDDLHMAKLQLVLAQQQQQQTTPKNNGTVPLPPPAADGGGSDMQPLEYTSSTYLVVAVALAIVAYFCVWRAKKPAAAAYRPINTGGWAATAAGESSA